MEPAETRAASLVSRREGERNRECLLFSARKERQLLFKTGKAKDIDASVQFKDHSLFKACTSVP